MMGTTWGRRGRRGRLQPLTHPLTHPSIQPPMNPPMARGVSANHKSSNRIELSWFSQDLFDFLWFDMTPPINPANHPPIGGGVSTDFKSSNRIKISWIIQVLLNFYWFGWSPEVGVGVGGGLNGDLGMMWGWMDDVGMTWTTWGWQGWHGEDGEDGEDTTIIINMLAAICNFLRVCVHVHTCACMCTCVGTPPDPPPPTCPLPRAEGSPKHQNSISPELIKIIRFCLKILYLWTFLNSYRL